MGNEAGNNLKTGDAAIMYSDEIVWKNAYNLGVAELDDAHKKLFAVIKRMLRLLNEKDYEKNRWTCAEALKFMESYTVQHFAQEEAYMKKINYDGYEMHKKLHDNLRCQTLPALDEELLREDYSKPAIERFIGVFIAWLNWHVMVEDMAINGKKSSRWNYHGNDEQIDMYDAEMKKFMKRLFDVDVNIVSRHYGGETIGRTCIYYSMNLEGSNGTKVDITLMAEHPVIFHMAGSMSDTKITVLNKAAFIYFVQLSQNIALEIMKLTLPDEVFTVKKHKVISHGDLVREFDLHGYPDISVLWKSDLGYQGLMFRKVPNENE